MVFGGRQSNGLFWCGIDRREENRKEWPWNLWCNFIPVYFLSVSASWILDLYHDFLTLPAHPEFSNLMHRTAQLFFSIVENFWLSMTDVSSDVIIRRCLVHLMSQKFFRSYFLLLFQCLRIIDRFGYVSHGRKYVWIKVFSAKQFFFKKMQTFLFWKSAHVSVKHVACDVNLTIHWIKTQWDLYFKKKLY